MDNEDKTAAVKVKYIGNYYQVYLENGAIYDAMIVDGLYQIYDEDDQESYLFDPQYFELIEQ